MLSLHCCSRSFIENGALNERGVGALFAVHATVFIQPSGLRMIANNHSALYLHRSNVVIHSNGNQNTTIFINNTGNIHYDNI